MFACSEIPDGIVDEQTEWRSGRKDLGHDEDLALLIG